jgi:hypothetical protein
LKDEVVFQVERRDGVFPAKIKGIDLPRETSMDSRSVM